MIPWGSEAQQAKMEPMDGWRLVGQVWHGPQGERLPAITGGQDPDPSDPFWLVLDLDDVTLGGTPIWELGELTDWLNTSDWSRGVFDPTIPDFWQDAATSGAILADYGLTREDIPFLTGMMGSDLSGPAGFDPAGLERGGDAFLGRLFVDAQNRIVDESGAVIVEASGLAEIERGIEAISTRPGDPTAWQRVTAALKPVNEFIKSPVGGILATLGLGGLGLALGSAISGGGGRYTPPPPQLTPGQELVNRLLTQNPQLSGVLSQALGTSLGAQQTVAQILGEQAERELMAGRDQASVEADIRARALQTMQDYLSTDVVDPRTIAAQDPLTRQIRALTERQAVTNLGGPPDEVGEGFRRSLVDLFAPGAQDPVTEALQGRVLAAARGEAPSPQLDRLEREEMDQLLNAFALRGPQYGESSAGIEKLSQLKQMQSERRENLILATLSTLEPQLVQRELLPGRQAGQLAPLLQARETLPNLQLTSLANILGGREQGALSIANLFANQLEQRRTGAQALVGTGRTSPAALQLPLSSIASIPSITGVSELNTGTADMNRLNQYLGLQSFLAGEQARQGLGSSIANIFARAGAAGFGLPA